VLNELGFATADMIDGVFALLDDTRSSWFSKPPENATFSSGATTAHLGCHIGILQRGKTKLDREGRDYWIKPLRSVGAIEPVLLVGGAFIAGHPVAKSSNSAYRLSGSFVEILRAPENEWREFLRAWSSENEIRRRLEFQAEVERAAAKGAQSAHANLILACVEHYAARFLVGYDPIYVDVGDGERVTDDDRESLRVAGIQLTLADAMPDVLLWNRATDALWVIEAVVSDGEVDIHKVDQLRRLAERSKKTRIDFTTAYLTWSTAAQRQGRYKNIAPGTYLWIQADPSRHFLAASFPLTA
jgi:BsuBI/PstI restriction endonuclease domain